MKQSESIKEIMGAIQSVQQSVGVIKKESTGSTGKRDYKFASLKATWDSAQPAIKSADLVITQSPTTGNENYAGQFFQTTIYHVKSGEWIEQTMQMVITKDDPQSIGAAITYYRRYMLTSMLGLIPDDDTDAGEQKLATGQQKRQLYGAFRAVYPDITEAGMINKTLSDILGKHPTYLRADEADDAVELVKAFRSDVDQTNPKDEE